jgi:oxazoline/thiazoline dehydrogenase
MARSLVISLSPFASLEEEAPDGFAFRLRHLRLAVPQPGAELLAALREVAGAGALQDGLIRRLPFHDALRLDFYLHELIEQGWLCHAVWEDGAPFATCVPIQRDHRLSEAPAPGSRWMISRFALVRRAGGRMLLESPLARAHIELHHPRASALLAAMAAPRSASELAAEAPGTNPATAELFLELLARAGFATSAGPDGSPSEDADPALLQWEFHDLFFHTRNREGRHANPYGGVDRFSNTEPAVKPHMSADFIALDRPDLDRLRSGDVPFTRVLEDRKSRRDHGSPAISARELGEFLFRAARVTRVVETSKGAHSWRPYPTGGASYELEIYPVIGECAGLDAGIYQYCPLEHGLCRIGSRNEHTEWLLENTGYSIHGRAPQVLFQIAARFRRVNWRYASMAYATVLKDTGILMQTMYLVAEAMGLAACAVGGGHSDIFARASGTSYYEETTVGEFILGSRSDGAVV